MGSRNLSLMSENLFHFDVDRGLLIFLTWTLDLFLYFLRKKFQFIFCTPHTLRSTEMYILHSIHLDLQRRIFCTPHTPQSTEMYILYSTYTWIYRDVYFALHIHFNLHRYLFCTPHTL